MRRLLEREELGDRKPSYFLIHFGGLFSPVVPDDVMRPLWFIRLPVKTQKILASQTSSTLDNLANLANSIGDFVPSICRIAENQSVPPLKLMV